MTNYEDRHVEPSADPRDREAGEKKERVETSEAPRPERKPKLISKKVANCSKLNVREEPVADAKVLKTIEKDDIVKIDQKFSDPTFERVVFPGGVVGFVNKAYLAPL